MPCCEKSNLRISWISVGCVFGQLTSWWMFIDFISDGATVYLYKSLCDTGELPCYFWIFGLLFMFLPTVMATIFFCYKDGWKSGVYSGLFYIIFIPIRGICSNLTKSQHDQSKVQLSYIKLFEVVFEAFPQICLTYAYLAIKGMKPVPWIPLFSNLISTIMMITGCINGCRAWKNS